VGEEQASWNCLNDLPRPRLRKPLVNKPQNDHELKSVRRCVNLGQSFGSEREYEAEGTTVYQKLNVDDSPDAVVSTTKQRSIRKWLDVNVT